MQDKKDKTPNQSQGKILSLLNESSTFDNEKAMLKKHFNLTEEQVLATVDPKTLQVVIQVSFSSKKAAEKFTEQLSDMAVLLKTDQDNSVTLTSKDFEAIAAWQQKLEVEKSTLALYLFLDKNAISSTIDKQSRKATMRICFSSFNEAENFSQKLFDLGVKNPDKPDEAKPILAKNTLVLTETDTKAVKSAYIGIASQSEMLCRDFNLARQNISPSINPSTFETHIKLCFASSLEAQSFAKTLKSNGITSLTCPGKEKSVQAGNSLILTKEDCKRLLEKKQEKEQPGPAQSPRIRDF